MEGWRLIIFLLFILFILRVRTELQLSRVNQMVLAVKFFFFFFFFFF